MANKFKLYNIVKRWIRSESVAHESNQSASNIHLQTVNLEPVFDVRSNKFSGVFCRSLLNYQEKDLRNQVNECLMNIAYWHFHGRAIRCILPIRAESILCQETMDEIECILIASELPVGLVTIGISGTKGHSFQQLEPNLSRMKRLGIHLEMLNFSGTFEDFRWLEYKDLSAVHFSLSLMRSAYKERDSLKILLSALNQIKTSNFHTYCGGISLVHDFIFAKKYGIHFCYGPLMMPTVSKHQILKIKDSQFASILHKPTPSQH